jgi:phosphatidylglycerophosphatase A
MSTGTQIGWRKGANTAMPPRERWAQRPAVMLLATGFGSGLIRPYSGTWGSIPATFLAWWLLRTGNDVVYAASTVAVIMLSIWASGAAEEVFGPDSGRIVIDEWAGVFVCFLGLPSHWHAMIPVFVLFRILDVWKPFPTRRLELLPGGWGVTADDLMAAVYTNVAVRILTLIWPAWFLV